jgi:hypothetical protein
MIETILTVALSIISVVVWVAGIAVIGIWVLVVLAFLSRMISNKRHKKLMDACERPTTDVRRVLDAAAAYAPQSSDHIGKNNNIKL